VEEFKFAVAGIVSCILLTYSEVRSENYTIKQCTKLPED
jgi:hypothetical protein